jgi:hypothetical protein
MAVDVDDYLDLIRQSLTQIEQGYFKLETTYEPSGIVRERVFCYELYHRLRCNMTESHRVSLNGEIDKRGHQDIKADDQKNPDFVFHVPGEWEGNTLIVEVKGKLDFDGIEKDFETLDLFVNEYRYKAGVFIIYNHSMDEFRNFFKAKIDSLASLPSANLIYIMAIKSADQSCCYVKLSDLLVGGH